MSDAQQPTWEDRLAELREKYEDVRDNISMSDVTGKLGDIATEIAGLPGEIAHIRERGYAFAGYLERKADVLETQWNDVRQQVQSTIQTEIERVQSEFDEVSGLWLRLEAQRTETGQDRLFTRVETALDEVDSVVSAARERIEGLYGNVPDNVHQTQQQLRTINTYLDRAAEATVKWGPTEAIYMAHQAEWEQTGKDKQDPDGILYLTDQRLIFEQKEKVGGRFGFGGDQVQEVLFETPVGAITTARGEDKGVFGGRDLVHLELSSGDHADITFEIKGGIEPEWYVQQLNRVITGEIDHERAIPVDETIEQAVREAPTTCTTCGATLPPLTRGVTELTCEYCGTMVRI